MVNITHQTKNSQRFTKFFIGGLFFSVPRIFWRGIYRTSLPSPFLCNLFLQKALVAAANKDKETLHLIDTQDEKNLSPFGFTQKRALLRVQPHQAKHYLKQALLELQIAELPSLSLIIPKKSFKTERLVKSLKKIWEKELGIPCQLTPFPPKKGDQTLHLAFAEWNASSKDPLFLLDAFKKGTDELKSTNNACWEHPGYQSLFDKTKGETNLKQRENKISSLEEMVIQNLSILPLFYEKKVIYR